MIAFTPNISNGEHVLWRWNIEIVPFLIFCFSYHRTSYLLLYIPLLLYSFINLFYLLCTCFCLSTSFFLSTPLQFRIINHDQNKHATECRHISSNVISFDWTGKKTKKKIIRWNQCLYVFFFWLHFDCVWGLFAHCMFT